MKFVTLGLQAFGPFANVTLDLAAEGLHLLYGPNEAGKSSALRAIRQALYGMDSRSRDDFRHPATALRLSALLERRDGRQFAFVRRKGGKNSLREADDQTALAEDALDQWLAGIDADKFAMMFGIDHERLRAGGAEIVRGEGRLAETLFAAAGGVANLQKIQGELSKDSEALYTPRGRNPLISKKKSELEAARKALQKAELRGGYWHNQNEALQSQERQRLALLERLAEVKRGHARFTRFETAFPLIARWKAAQAHFAEYADVPLLPENCRRIYEQHEQDARLQHRLAEQAQDDLEKLASETGDASGVNILGEEEAIERLREQLGVYLQARRDRPGLVTQREAAERLMAQTLQSLGPGDDQRWHAPAPDRKVRLQRLGAEQRAVFQQRDDRKSAFTRLERKLADLRTQRSSLPARRDHGVLRKLVERVRNEGDLAGRLEALTAEITRREASLTARLARLPHWNGSLHEFETLVVPEESFFEAHEAEFREIDSAAKNEQLRHRDVKRTIERLDDQLRQLEADGAIPTDDDLMEARFRRDAAWQSLEVAWHGGLLPAPWEREEFLAALHAADHCVDRLRTAAERVAKKTELLIQRAQAETERIRSAAEVAEWDRRREALNVRWRSAWSRLTSNPSPVAEMRRWMQEREAILEEREACRSLHADRAEMAERSARLLRELDATTEAPQPSATLALALARAESLLEAGERLLHTERQLDESIEQLAEEHSSLVAEIDTAESHIRTWQAAWTEAVAPWGLAASATVDEALAVLQAVEELLQQRAQAQGIQDRIQEIDDYAANFSATVQAMVERHCPEALPRDVEGRMSALVTRLDAARTQRDQMAALQKQRTQLHKQRDKARAAQTVADAALDALCAQAGGVPRAELATVLERSEQRRKLQATLDGLAEQLLTLACGATLTDFITEAESLNADTLRGQLDELASQQAQLETELSAVDQAIGTAREALRAMQGSGSAADQAELCQSLAAELQDATREYAVLRLSAAILQKGIERYRTRHEGPLLARAGALFAKLTTGSFSGLRPDTGEKGEPILVGVRPHGGIVAVGGMSDGACDQLYLALRLAGLEDWLEHHEPMPFIVDDILLNFDDARSAAALEVLGELSRRTQVLFFTHHQRLVEIARQHIPRDLLHLHTLPVSE